MSYRVLSIHDDLEWDRILGMLPVKQQDVYYSSHYYKLFEKQGDGKAQCFVFEHEGNLAIYPYLINSVNEKGYNLANDYYDIQGAYGYNGIVSSSQNKDFINTFYISFNQYCKEHNIIAEFTRFNPLIENHTFSHENMNCIYDRKTVFIPLSQDYDTVKKKYQRSTRKQINRMKRDPEVEVIDYDNCDVSLIREMYEIYLESMKRLNANPSLYFDMAFFEQLLEIEYCKLIVFMLNGKAISFISFFHYNDLIHGFLGGTLNEYLKRSPFSLLYDRMITYGVENKASLVHVGGGATTDPEDKLMQYKLHFSKTTKDFYIGKKVHNSPVYEDVLKQWKARSNGEKDRENKQLLRYRDIT